MTATLSDICEAIVDCEHRTAPEGDGYALLVGTRAMKSGRLIVDACKPVSELTYNNWTRRMRPEPGDLILAREAPVGQVVRVPEGLRICLGQRTVLIRPNADQVHPRFLHYWLLGPHAQAAMAAQAAGATVPHLNVEDIRNLDINRLPHDPQIQAFAASVLGALDDLIENNQRRIELLEQMAQSIYREWFVRFRFPGYEDVPLGYSDLGSIPEGWKVGTLNDLLILQRGFDLPKKNRRPGSIPVIAATGQHGTHESAAVKGPGVLTGRSGSLGKVLYIVRDFWPLNTTLWVKEFRRATPEFAFYALKSLGLEQFNSGAAVPTLNRNDISGHPVIIPSADVIRWFSDVVRDIFRLKVTLENSSVVLRATHDYLLPRLISGEVDRSEIEVFLGDPAA